MSDPESSSSFAWKTGYFVCLGLALSASRLAYGAHLFNLLKLSEGRRFHGKAAWGTSCSQESPICYSVSYSSTRVCKSGSPTLLELVCVACRSDWYCQQCIPETSLWTLFPTKYCYHTPLQAKHETWLPNIFKFKQKSSACRIWLFLV